MDNNNTKLNEARIKINEIDQKMAKLFEERMNAAYDVAMYKKDHSLPIFDKSREQEVINKNINYISNDTIKEYYVNFLQGLMDISKNYQGRLLKGMKVAYSGVAGAFAHIAAMRLFPGCEYVSYPDFYSAYQAVTSGECDSCILPLENSFAGEVGLVMDLMFSGSLYINQVIEIDIVHNLLGKKGATLKDIKKVYSHQQALNQCLKYLNKHKFEKIETENTALAAKYVASLETFDAAAIASSDTAKLYDLEILESNINESRNNTTRFGAFSRCLNVNNNNALVNHSILVFTVKNEAGALAKTLNIIGSYGFNMRSLRSRPMKELIWNYYFYVELEGNVNSREGDEMLKALKVFCDKLKVVGIYR